MLPCCNLSFLIFFILTVDSVAMYKMCSYPQEQMDPFLVYGDAYERIMLDSMGELEDPSQQMTQVLYWAILHWGW